MHVDSGTWIVEWFVGVGESASFMLMSAFKYRKCGSGMRVVGYTGCEYKFVRRESTSS